MINPRVADLRKRAALLRAEAHALEDEAKVVEAIESEGKQRPGDHIVVPRAGNLGVHNG